MPMRGVGAAVLAVLAGCGGSQAEAEREGPAGEPAASEPASRFEVSVDTQKVATPDSQVAPSENPDNE